MILLRILEINVILLLYNFDIKNVKFGGILLSTIEDDIKSIEQIINDLISETKKYSVSDLVSKDVKISTICRFRQRRDDIFSINTDTLFKIAKRLDELNDKEKKLEKTLHMS